MTQQPTLVLHCCPGCPETARAVEDATVSHACPNRRGRRTIFVPDDQTTNRNEEPQVSNGAAFLYGEGTGAFFALIGCGIAYWLSGRLNK